MNPTILGVIGPGFLNQVPTLNPNSETPDCKMKVEARWGSYARALEAIQGFPYSRVFATRILRITVQ